MFATTMADDDMLYWEKDPDTPASPKCKYGHRKRINQRFHFHGQNGHENQKGSQTSLTAHKAQQDTYQNSPHISPMIHQPCIQSDDHFTTDRHSIYFPKHCKKGASLWVSGSG